MPELHQRQIPRTGHLAKSRLQRARTNALSLSGNSHVAVHPGLPGTSPRRTQARCRLFSAPLPKSRGGGERSRLRCCTFPRNPRTRPPCRGSTIKTFLLPPHDFPRRDTRREPQPDPLHQRCHLPSHLRSPILASASIRLVGVAPPCKDEKAATHPLAPNQGQLAA
jgi:hypothetical protein